MLARRLAGRCISRIIVHKHDVTDDDINGKLVTTGYFESLKEF